jgi:Flp pilus assembly protein TadD
VSASPRAADASRRAGLSPDALAIVERIDTALRQRRIADAEREIAALRAIAPDHAETLRLGALVDCVGGRPRDAIAPLRRAIALRPDDALMHTNLGSALAGCGEMREAIDAFRRSAALAPGSAEAWFNLGAALEQGGDSADARDALASAIARQPAHLHARFLLARVAQRMGDFRESEAQYLDILAREPAAGAAWFGLAHLKSRRFSAGELDTMRALYARRDLDAMQRVQLGYALSRALEDHDRYAEAFAVLTAASAAKRRMVSWNGATFSRFVDDMIGAFDTPLEARADPSLGAGIVFVISLPRSGSTLVEQMLAAHPDIAAAGERVDLPDIVGVESKQLGRSSPAWVHDATAADWQRLGEDYLARVGAARNGRVAMTDKGVGNWKYIGHALAMMPAARFVEIRRDATETCLACFRQLFSADLQPMTYDLAELAAYHRDYTRLTDFWAAREPGRIHRLRYEDLVAAPESELRRLLAFLDLPFDAACLDFHAVERDVRTSSSAQVREPLRADTARAARYGDLLAPLRRALGEA